MIAACDTFRAGAVEQLRTHCQRLQIPLFEKGYEKDPAKVAFEATIEAQRQNCDVLLVDTAGPPLCKINPPFDKFFQAECRTTSR